MRFASLRYKLIASYMGIILLFLLLAGSSVVYVLRDYQQRIRLDQLADLAFPISATVRSLEDAGATPAQIVGRIRIQGEFLRTRIILTDRTGFVIEDTGDELDGQQLTLPTTETNERRSNTPRAYYTSNADGLFLIAPAIRWSGEMRRAMGASSNYVVILAVPQANVVEAWWELAPSLTVAAAISLFVSILVALILTRSIARPLVQMTRASEEMARGRYDQSIPVRGHDEIARLATAFNAMASQVATSDRTMRDFLANVSHELKTPLTSIQGFSQAMLDGTITMEEQYRNAASIINVETVGMRRMVGDLLTLSKIESGQITMENEPVDIEGSLRDIVRRAEFLAEAAGIHIVLEVDSSAAVLGDERWLGQVFSNLLDNAIKHASDGSRVTVSAKVHETTHDVEVTFHNVGSYIPRDDLPRVFERFFQVDRSRSARVEGSGLGLAIVREVVQSHSGTVEAESDHFTGTTFRIHLPLYAPSSRASTQAVTKRVA